MKKCFSDQQIISILREAEAGVFARELCRRHAISDATFYTWRKKYGGMEVPGIKRLKSCEENSARLRALLRREGLHVNHKRAYRLYHLSGLGVNADDVAKGWRQNVCCCSARMCRT